MYAFHTLWTKPSFLKKDPYKMNNAEILTMVISALMWRKYNGKIKLFTDKEGLNFIEKNNLSDIWNEIDVSVLENNTYSIDPTIFWAAGKLIALEASTCPCVMLDTDLIVVNSINNILSGSEITALHSEPLNSEVYINPNYLKKPNGYNFPIFYDWNVLPSNTAFLYISDNRFRNFYLEQSKSFMFNNFEKPMENISQMVFAEQRLLSICAAIKDIDIHYLLESPYSLNNATIVHLWGFKEVLRKNSVLEKLFIDKLINRFNKDLKCLQDIALPYLQAHCQSPSSQRSNQSFVKELAMPTQREKLL